MTKVKKITVSNLKAVKDLSVDFNGCTAIITGGNNKGKSSFLKSLPDRLRGEKPEMILKQGEDKGFAEMELTTGEKLLWEFDGKKEKLTYVSDRNIAGALTKDICKRYFPVVFDVDEFLNSAPAKQKKTLQGLTGIDFTEIDAVYKEAYDNRTWANKQVTETKARTLFYDPKMGTEKESTAALENELNGIDAHNLRYSGIEDKMADKKKRSDSLTNEIKELSEKIKSLEAERDAIQTDLSNGDKWLKEDKNKPKSNASDLQAAISKIKESNAAIDENLKAKELNEAYEKAVVDAQAADAEVKRIELEKLEVIKNANMPDGFGFSDEGITYNGFAYDSQSQSSSAKIIGALKLAALSLGEVRCLHFDASFLDKNNLLEIEKWATDNNLQLLIERPDFEGGEIEYQILSEIK